MCYASAKHNKKNSSMITGKSKTKFDEEVYEGRHDQRF